MRRKVLFLTILTTAFLGAGAMFLRGRQRAPAEPLVKVGRGNVEHSLDFHCRMTYRDVFPVFAPVAGRVERITVREGDRVNAGQALATISPLTPDVWQVSDLTQRRQSQRITVQSLERELRRVRDSRSFSVMEIEKMESDLAVKRNELSHTEAQLQSVMKSIGLASSAARTATASAPVAGRVVWIGSAAGLIVTNVLKQEASLSLDDALVIVSESDVMVARCDVQEPDVIWLQPEQDAEIVMAAMPGSRFSGRVASVRQTRFATGEGPVGFEMDVLVQGAENRIRAGISADVTVSVAKKENVLTLPRSAVAVSRGFAAVDRTGKGLTLVRTGVVTENWVELTDPQLPEGAEVHELDFSRIDLEALGKGVARWRGEGASG